MWTPAETRALLQLEWRDPRPDPTNRLDRDPRAIEFGRLLFHDPGLSSDSSLSCASCHDPARAFTDGRPVAEGRTRESRQTPTIENVGHQRWFFWDGRVDTLWGQALEPIEDSREFDSTRVDAIRHVATTPDLRRRYEEIFDSLPTVEDATRFPPRSRPYLYSETKLSSRLPAEVHAKANRWDAMAAIDQESIQRAFVNVGKAIAAFEGTIRSPQGRFDRYVAQVRENRLHDESPSLSAAEVRGLRLFIGKANCRSCHHGAAFSDFEFHDTRVSAGEFGQNNDPGRYVGLPEALASEFSSAGAYSDDPDGVAARRLHSTPHRPSQFGEFKTPTLRGISRTAPYMHAGQIETLEGVVRFYSTREGAKPLGHHDEQLLLPLGLSEAEIGDLVAFLMAL